MIDYQHLSVLHINFYMFRSRGPSSENPSGEWSVVVPSEISCVVLQDDLGSKETELIGIIR